jgi:hypothetical protein
MKKIFRKLAVLALACPLVLAACSSDDDAQRLINVVFNAAPAVDGTLELSALEGTEVMFTDVRNQDAKSFTLDAEGKANVAIAPGTYNISISKTVKNEQGEDVKMAMVMENVALTQDLQVVDGKVTSLPMSALGQDFIFSEVFFNGETNSGRMMHPDQYIVLFNPTNETLYADGICIAVTQHISWWDKKPWYDSFYPNRVPIGGFITIPGNGTDVAVAPGEKLVIAFTAVNHAEVVTTVNDVEIAYDHAVDLSGADYEIYYGPDASDVDNPDVPNVLISENGDSYGFFFQPRGYVSPLIFRLADGKQETIDAFIAANASKFTQTTEEGDVESVIWSVETSKILDGIQTSDVPQDVKTRCIPVVVDEGKFLVNGCHRQELCIRKEIKVGDKIFYQDTNNSSEDMEDVNERKAAGKYQTAFPLGWRIK